LEDCPAILADPQRLGECFEELVANAHFWSNKRDKRIKAHIRRAFSQELPLGLDPRKTYLHITFADTGLGVPWPNKLRIFEPFFSTDPQGTGLGLAIVRRIIIGHGGDIIENGQPEPNVEAQSGQHDYGAKFEIFIPLVEQAGAKADSNETMDA
jgi:signal transduction histidine kinase